MSTTTIVLHLNEYANYVSFGVYQTRDGCYEAAVTFPANSGANDIRFILYVRNQHFSAFVSEGFEIDLRGILSGAHASSVTLPVVTPLVGLTGADTTAGWSGSATDGLGGAGTRHLYVADMTISAPNFYAATAVAPGETLIPGYVDSFARSSLSTRLRSSMAQAVPVTTQTSTVYFDRTAAKVYYTAVDLSVAPFDTVTFTVRTVGSAAVSHEYDYAYDLVIPGTSGEHYLEVASPVVSYLDLGTDYDGFHGTSTGTAGDFTTVVQVQVQDFLAWSGASPTSLFASGGASVYVYGPFPYISPEGILGTYTPSAPPTAPLPAGIEAAMPGYTGTGYVAFRTALQKVTFSPVLDKNYIADLTIRYQSAYQLEAEAATLSASLSTADAYSGRTGAGSVSAWSTNGQYVRFSVSVAFAGSVDLMFRCSAAAGTAVRRLKVNGSTIGNLTFPGTGSWTAWQYVTTTVALVPGVNTVELLLDTASGSSQYLVLDHLRVAGAPVSYPLVRLEAEAAVVTGGIDVTNPYTGHTGTATVSNWSTNGQYVRFTVMTGSAGAVNLAFRYSAEFGNAVRRLKVNGSTIGNLTFSSTASWIDWQYLTASATLLSGVNTVELLLDTASGSSQYLVLDHLQVPAPAAEATRLVTVNGEVTPVSLPYSSSWTTVVVSDVQLQPSTNTVEILYRTSDVGSIDLDCIQIGNTVFADLVGNTDRWPRYRCDAAILDEHAYPGAAPAFGAGTATVAAAASSTPTAGSASGTGTAKDVRNALGVATGTGVAGALGRVYYIDFDYATKTATYPAVNGPTDTTIPIVFSMHIVNAPHLYDYTGSVGSFYLIGVTGLMQIPIGSTNIDPVASGYFASGITWTVVGTSSDFVSTTMFATAADFYAWAGAPGTGPGTNTLYGGTYPSQAFPYAGAYINSYVNVPTAVVSDGSPWTAGFPAALSVALSGTNVSWATAAVYDVRESPSYSSVYRYGTPATFSSSWTPTESDGDANIYVHFDMSSVGVSYPFPYYLPVINHPIAPSAQPSAASGTGTAEDVPLKNVFPTAAGGFGDVSVLYIGTNSPRAASASGTGIAANPRHTYHIYIDDTARTATMPQVFGPDLTTEMVFVFHFVNSARLYNYSVYEPAIELSGVSGTNSIDIPFGTSTLTAGYPAYGITWTVTGTSSNYVAETRFATAQDFYNWNTGSAPGANTIYGGVYPVQLYPPQDVALPLYYNAPVAVLSNGTPWTVGVSAAMSMSLSGTAVGDVTSVDYHVLESPLYSDVAYSSSTGPTYAQSWTPVDSGGQAAMYAIVHVGPYNFLMSVNASDGYHPIA